jgi:hypothetical protein
VIPWIRVEPLNIVESLEYVVHLWLRRRARLRLCSIAILSHTKVVNTATTGGGRKRAPVMNTQGAVKFTV